MKPLYNSENKILAEVGSYVFSAWLDEAKKRKAKKIIVFRDEFENFVYPHFLLDGENEESKIQEEIGDRKKDMTTFLGTINTGSTGKKYKLGNQPEEYELKTDYLGWLPEDKKDWDSILDPMVSSSDIRGKELTIINPTDNTQKVILTINRRITKDAFHLEFFGEERTKNWYNFCIVSIKEEKFIIPLH